MKKPDECMNIADVRYEIDAIDRQIIALISDRYNYVKAAGKFKTSETSVRAPERFAAMLLQRRQWAEDENLSADVIEKLYRDLVNYFIAEELDAWKKSK